MWRISLGLAALGLGLNVAPGAWAQGSLRSTRPLTIGAGGGVSVPTSNARDSIDTGFHALGFVGLSIPGIPVGLRGTFTFNRFDLKPEGVGLPGNTDEDVGYEQVLSGLVNIVLPFPAGRVTPYLMAGLGAFNIRTKRTQGDDSASKTEFGINGGAGITFPISRLDAFVEARVNNVYTSEDGTIDPEDIQFIPVTFGVSYSP